MCGERVALNATACPYCGEQLGSIATGQRGLWRDGQILVMEKTAELPDRCVKSNRNADWKLRRKLSWHHPALYLLIFVGGVLPGIFLFAFVALIIRQTASIHIGLTDEWFTKRRRVMFFSWVAASHQHREHPGGNCDAQSTGFLRTVAGHVGVSGVGSRHRRGEGPYGLSETNHSDARLAARRLRGVSRRSSRLGS